MPTLVALRKWQTIIAFKHDSVTVRSFLKDHHTMGFLLITPTSLLQMAYYNECASAGDMRR